MNRVLRHLLLALAASALTDLPSGAMAVCAMAATGALLALLAGRRLDSAAAEPGR